MLQLALQLHLPNRGLEAPRPLAPRTEGLVGWLGWSLRAGSCAQGTPGHTPHQLACPICAPGALRTQAERVSQLVMVTGIVTASSKPRVRRRCDPGAGGSSLPCSSCKALRCFATLCRLRPPCTEPGLLPLPFLEFPICGFGSWGQIAASYGPPPPLRPQHKATSLVVQCKSCKGLLPIACKPGMGGAIVPRYCALNTNPVPGSDKCDEEPYQVGLGVLSLHKVLKGCDPVCSQRQPRPVGQTGAFEEAYQGAPETMPPLQLLAAWCNCVHLKPCRPCNSLLLGPCCLVQLRAAGPPAGGTLLHARTAACITGLPHHALRRCCRTAPSMWTSRRSSCR